MDFRALVLFVSLLQAGCLPKRPAGTSTERGDPWSQAGLERALDEVLPYVEAVAGRAFLRRPKVAIADETTFRQLLVEEQLRIYARVMADTPESIRVELANAAGAYMTSGILGKYVLDTETVYVCPNALVPAMVDTDLPPSRAWDVVRVVVAHEIVHALEDQHTDLERVLDALPDEEALWAASGVWEGWATLVEERVAARLDASDVFEALISLQGWGPDGLRELSAWRTWAIYGQGRIFAEFHDQRGGAEAVWDTLTHPPASTSMLFRPATYAARPSAPGIDYGAVLRGVEQTLSPGDWLVTNSRLGEFDLRGEAVMADNERQLDEVLGHLVHAHHLDVARPERAAEVRLLVFDDPAWPMRYLDLIRTQSSHEALETALGLELPVEVRYEVFDGISTDNAIFRTETIPLFAGNTETVESVWIVRAQDVVVVASSRHVAGPETLGRVGALVLERLDAARVGQGPR